MAQLPPFRVDLPSNDSRYSSPAWPSPSLAPPAYQLAARRALSFDPEKLIDSIESPTPSPAPEPTSQALHTKKQPRTPARRLNDADKLMLLQLCQSYSRVYLNDKPMSQFWRLITSEFNKVLELQLRGHWPSYSAILLGVPTRSVYSGCSVAGE
jgi:hypothetical protein